MGLFGKEKPKDPKETVQQFRRVLTKEGRKLDRQINSIGREELKVQRSIKDAAKKGHKDVCLTLAKEIIASRKATKRLYNAKAQLNSVSLSMQQQYSMMKVAGACQKSAEVMKLMQSLCKIPDIQATMMELSKEMMKAGIIEEMLEDTFESFEDQDELEDAAQEEVDKLLFEITKGELSSAPAVADDDLPEAVGATAMSDNDEEEEDMQSRLEALRS